MDQIAQKKSERQKQQDNLKKELKIDSIDFQENSESPFLGFFTISLITTDDKITNFQYIIINQQEKKIHKVLSFNNEIQNIDQNDFLKFSIISICDFVKKQLKCIPISAFINDCTASLFCRFFKIDILKPYKVLVSESIQLKILFPKQYLTGLQSIDCLSQIQFLIKQEYIFYLNAIIILNKENIYFSDKYRKKSNNQIELGNLVIKLVEKYCKLIEIQAVKEQMMQNNNHIPKVVVGKASSSNSNQKPNIIQNKQTVENNQQSLYNINSSKSEQVFNQVHEKKQLNSDEQEQMRSTQQEKNELQKQINKQNEFQFNNTFLQFQNQAKKQLEDKQNKEKIEFKNSQNQQKQKFDQMINALIKDFNNKQKEQKQNFDQSQEKELSEFEINMVESFQKIQYWQDKINNKN